MTRLRPESARGSNTVYQIYNREQQEQRLKRVLSLSMSRSQVSKLVDQTERKLEQFRKNNNLMIQSNRQQP